MWQSPVITTVQREITHTAGKPMILETIYYCFSLSIRFCVDGALRYQPKHFGATLVTIKTELNCPRSPISLKMVNQFITEEKAESLPPQLFGMNLDQTGVVANR